MRTEVLAQFDDPRTVATYIGEAVGTHYSAALRAVEAYGKHLASNREKLHREPFDGEGLGEFWSQVMKSEQVLSSSATARKELALTPAHYFSDFLDTADAVFEKKYKDVPVSQKKKLGHSQHAMCLRILRDHTAEGIKDHFAVRNRVTTWIQMIKATGGYQE